MNTNLIEMKLQTIGVEIEMCGITRENAAKLAAEFFGTGRYEYTAIRNGYYTWSAWDTDGREWKFSRDVSIIAPDPEQTELVTPILVYSDIPILQELVRKLRKAGAISRPSKGCGVHIHIGGDGHNAKTLRNLINLMASHEKLLINSIRVAGDRIRRYCRTVEPELVEKVNRIKPKTEEELKSLWYSANRAEYGQTEHYNDSRYHCLNLHSYFNGHGTVEFRLFQFDEPTAERKGGLHAGQLKAFIQLCLGMSRMAKASRNINPTEVQSENPKFAMRTWLNRMGFIGEEFETARLFLTKNLEGDSAFRFNNR